MAFGTILLFWGYFLRWPTLIFTAIYIENPSLKSVKKLYYLNSKTSGAAHSIVSPSPLTNDDFRSACKNRTEFFEDKRLRVSTHLKTRFNVQSIAMDSGGVLKELQRNIQGRLTFIQFSGVNIEN